MQTQVLLENMSGKIDFTGNPVKSIGYYSNKTNKKIQSIAIHTLNFVGRFILEGSLKLEPNVDSDWFPIVLDNDLPYIEFNDFSPLNQNVIRNNKIYTFKGNYVWLRGRLDRSYLNIIKTPVVPYDLHSNTYVITAGSNINPDYSSGNYPKAKLNPQYDPEFHKGWTPNYSSAYNRQITSSTLGNIEKVILCF